MRLFTVSLGYKPSTIWSESRCVQFRYCALGASDSQGIFLNYSVPCFYVFFESWHVYITLSCFVVTDSIWNYDSTTSCFRSATGLHCCLTTYNPISFEVRYHFKCQKEWTEQLAVESSMPSLFSILFWKYGWFEVLDSQVFMVVWQVCAASTCYQTFYYPSRMLLLSILHLIDDTCICFQTIFKLPL